LPAFGSSNLLAEAASLAAFAVLREGLDGAVVGRLDVVDEIGLAGTSAGAPQTLCIAALKAKRSSLEDL